MTYNPLFLTASLTLGEKAALSGEMVLRGMGTVSVPVLPFTFCFPCVTSFLSVTAVTS